MDWARGNQANFWMSGPLQPQPYGGWAGRWDNGRDGRQPTDEDGAGWRPDPDSWDWIGLFPQKVKALLRDAGFEPVAIIRIWKDRGWLKCSDVGRGTNRTQFKTRVGTESAWLIAIKHAAVKEVERVDVGTGGVSGNGDGNTATTKMKRS
jgi:hypothetical protein